MSHYAPHFYNLFYYMRFYMPLLQCGAIKTIFNESINLETFYWTGALLLFCDISASRPYGLSMLTLFQIQNAILEESVSLFISFTTL